jgi:hypothetical protein
MVMDGLYRIRGTLQKDEADLAVHLRGNERLYDSLTQLIRSRIQRRDVLPVPSDPLECRGVLERNHELRWLLSRLEIIYRSPVNEEADIGEPPAA